MSYTAPVARLLAAADPALAGHVEVAVRGYKRALEAVGRPVPPAVADFLRSLTVSGQCSRSVPSTAHDENVGFLTVRQAAALAGLRARTIRRRLDDGVLPYVGEERARLIPIQALVQHLAEEATAA